MPANYVARREELQLLYMAEGGDLNVQGAITIKVGFIFRMPKGWSKKRKAETDGTWCLKKPDLDNCMGGVMDSILAEDSNVINMHGYKVWGYEDEIRIDIVSEDEAQYVPF